jgi:hypothetical protein
MRKLLIVAALVLVAAAAFAQEAPKNFEIYGSAWFDYGQTGTELNLAGTYPILSNFAFSKLRVGLRDQLADNVKAYLEWDPRNLEIRLAGVDWAPVEGLTVTMGKSFKVFAPQNWIPYASRMLLVGAKYAIPGIGWLGAQVGNGADFSPNLNTVKMWYPGTAKTNITPTLANPTDVLIDAAVVLKPDMGKDISLEVGVNAEIIPQKLATGPGVTQTTGLSVDAYAQAAAFGLGALVDFTFLNLNDLPASQLATLYTSVSYKIGQLTPTVWLYWDNITGTNTTKGNNIFYNTTPNMTLDVELPFAVTKDLKINPFFSYALTGYNAWEFWSTAPAGYYTANDWTAGIRFDYSFSMKF